MYPILAATLSREGERLSAGRGFAISLTYVLSLATGFSLFGIVAAWWGQSFQAALQSVPAMLVLAAIFVTLALSSFGLFEMQLPAFLRNQLTPHRGRRGSLASSAALGFSSALIIGPCVTAPLAGALLYIAQTGNVVLGAAALFALGFGKGMPLILMGTFGPGLLPHAGQWMQRIRRVFGFLFLATAVWFLDRVLPAGMGLLLWSALAIAFAVFVGAFDYMTPEKGVVPRLGKTVGLLSGIYGTLLAVGGLLGATDPLNPLAPVVSGQSAASGRSEAIGKDSFHSVASAADLSSLVKSGAKDTPSLVYFTADWCVTCRVIEGSVLPEAGVAQALDGVRLISVDLSKITDASRALMKDLQVVGPPTMLFLNGSNRELPGSRLVGEIDAVSIGLIVFLAVAAILARRVDNRLGWWSSWTALAGVAASRLGHVLQHLDRFGDDPLRAFAIWQGGFSWTGGSAGVAVMLIALVPRNRKLAGWAAASIAAGTIATASTLWSAGTAAVIPAPGTAFRSLAGTERMIGRSGRPMVLNLWASWCPPCRRELPMMAEVAANTAAVEFVFANQGETGRCCPTICAAASSGSLTLSWIRTFR